MHKLNFLSSIESSEDIAFPTPPKALTSVWRREQTDFWAVSTQWNRRRYLSSEGRGCCQSLHVWYLAAILRWCVYSTRRGWKWWKLPLLMMERMRNITKSANGNEKREEMPIVIEEDLVNIRLRKEKGGGLPVYKVSQEKGSSKSKTFALQRRKKSPFMLYDQQYIRKSTALYLLQENICPTIAFFAWEINKTFAYS